MSLDKFIERAKKIEIEIVTSSSKDLKFCNDNWHKVITALKEAKHLLRLSSDYGAANCCHEDAEKWLKKWGKEFEC